MIAISEFRDERFSLSRFLPSFLMCKKSVRKMQSTILKSVTFWTKKNKQRDPVINLTPTTVGYLPRTVYAFKRISCWTSGRCSSIKIQLNIPALVAWWFFFLWDFRKSSFFRFRCLSRSLSLARAPLIVSSARWHHYTIRAPHGIDTTRSGKKRKAIFLYTKWVIAFRGAAGGWDQKK